MSKKLNLTKFAERLRERRGSRTQFEMAAYLGVSQGAYGYWETGARQPKLDLLVHICKKLNVSADWILGLSDSLPQPDLSIGEKLAMLKAQSEQTRANMERIDRELAELAEKATR